MITVLVPHGRRPERREARSRGERGELRKVAADDRVEVEVQDRARQLRLP